MLRSALFLVLIASAACAHDARSGYADQVFAEIPFEQWLSHPDSGHIHWSTGISDTVLSPHQRLTARVWVQVDGRELAKRRGQGALWVLVQIADDSGRKWQNHQELDLEHVDQGIKSNDALFTQDVFLLPGDYSLAMAIYDTATKEHGLSKRRLHVAAIKNDPLSAGWSGLPAVEFLGPTLPPEGWYLPKISQALNLKLSSHEPVHVSLLVNLTPSERLAGSKRVQNRNLSLLLPAAKVLSLIDWGSRFQVKLLDLTRRKVIYQQDHAGAFDWPVLSGALEDANPGVIDVASLQNRWYSAQYFLDEVSAHLHPAPGRNALIILSSAVEFQGGQEIRPVSAPNANTAVYYIRYQPPVYAMRPGVRGPGPRAGFVPVDQLAALLKPLEPHLFEVQTPEQFRKTLATILSELSGAETGRLAANHLF